MFGFFTDILSAIGTAIKFVIDMVAEIVGLVGLVIKGATYLITGIAYLPPVISGIALAVVGFLIVLRFIGRE